VPIKSAVPLRVEFLPQGDGDLLFGRSSWHPTGFWVDKERARNLFRMAFDMQWRGVLNFDSSRVERAHIFMQQGNQTLTVEKGAAGWLDKDTGRLVQGIDITLWRLKELRIESEPATRLMNPAEPRLTLELFGKEVKPLAVYNFYVDPRLPAGQCWLRPGQEEVFYPVGTQIIEDLQGHLPPRAHRPAAASEAAVDLRKP